MHGPTLPAHHCHSSSSHGIQIIGYGLTRRQCGEAGPTRARAACRRRHARTRSGVRTTTTCGSAHQHANVRMVWSDPTRHDMLDGQGVNHCSRQQQRLIHGRSASGSLNMASSREPTFPLGTLSGHQYVRGLHPDRMKFNFWNRRTEMSHDALDMVV